MNKVVESIEKMKPYFETMSRNKYLRSVRNGFFAAMPIVLFSSMFMLAAYVPNIFGFYWSETIETLLVKPYDYTMGIFALAVSGTVAKNLTDVINREEMPKNNQINSISVLLASIASFMIVSVDPIEGGFSNEYMGTSGLLTAFIVSFIIPNIYKIFIKNNVTVKLPDEVPPNIAQSFLDLLPFSANITIFWIIDLFIRNYTGGNLAQAVESFFQPIFTAASGYFGLGLIAAGVPFFTFIGIHGSSIVQPAVQAVYYQNVDTNLELFQSGKHANLVLTEGMHNFVAGMGGSGATLMITIIFAFLSKSKKNKAVGRASIIPVLFGVNEPILFGAPIVLNPIFWLPFILTPVINAWILKLFIDVFKMNSFIYNLPWTIPGPLATIMGTGFAPLSFVLVLTILIVDFIIYYPFFKVYDQEQVALEAGGISQTDLDKTEPQELEDKEINDIVDEGKMVLVLCAGAGTSGQLANAINKGADEKGINIQADGRAYGQHHDSIEYYDLVILAPQVASVYEDLKVETDEIGINLVPTEGVEYINLTRNPQKALKFALQELNNE